MAERKRYLRRVDPRLDAVLERWSADDRWEAPAPRD
jgi:hypothetical protein